MIWALPLAPLPPSVTTSTEPEPDLEYACPPQWVRDEQPPPASPEILALMRDLRRRVPTRFR